jgi:uncharacterized membrane protein
MRSIRVAVIVIGVFLIGLGIYTLIYDQISNSKKVIEIGPIEATVHKGMACGRLPIVFGSLVIIAGGALVLLHITRRSD